MDYILAKTLTVTVFILLWSNRINFVKSTVHVQVDGLVHMKYWKLVVLS